ncbi:MAG: endoribonuclease MazF [Candidatus Woesearchaeota archaeon]
MEEKFGRGDIVWINFSPTQGHEQQGKRPAVVLSPQIYNDKSHLMIVAPITNKQKGYPFEIETKSDVITGVILSDQIRTIDWKARKVQKVGVVSDEIIKQVGQHLKLLLPVQ